MSVQQTNGISSMPSSLAISTTEDDQEVRAKYRPFLSPTSSTSEDWIEKLELTSVESLVEESFKSDPTKRLRVLVLYGSLRARSFSKALAYECARILFRLGCDVRVYNSTGLPIKNDADDQHPKVQELRKLSEWSEGHIWVSPEQHGNVTAVFKNQIDWIPLSTGSVRPTQGRTLAIAQVSGGSQSFNTVNTLRILGRWMRMFTIPNQSSVPMAYTQFVRDAEGNDRMIPSSNRDRVVDCMEEFVKFTLIMRPHTKSFDDRYSERLAKQPPPSQLSHGHKQNLKDGSSVNGVNLKAL